MRKLGRCKRCGAKEYLHEFLHHFVCHACLVILRIDENWEQRRRAAAIKRKENSEKTKKWKNDRKRNLIIGELGDATATSSP